MIALLSSSKFWIAVGMGALTGWGSAAVVDYKAFTSFKSLDEAKAYNWKIAVWNWIHGGVTGAVTAGTVQLGLGAL